MVTWQWLFAFSLSITALRLIEAQEDVPTSEWPAEWAPLIGMGGCAFVPTALGMGLTCDLELSESAAVQGMAPGISGQVCQYCPSSCAAAGQECPAAGGGGGPAPDVPTSEWPAEWAPLVGMGGCAFVPTALGMGLTCDMELSESATVQGMAPGISGQVCQYCGTSCANAGAQCPAAGGDPCGTPRPTRAPVPPTETPTRDPAITDAPTQEPTEEFNMQESPAPTARPSQTPTAPPVAKASRTDFCAGKPVQDSLYAKVGKGHIFGYPRVAIHDFMWQMVETNVKNALDSSTTVYVADLLMNNQWLKSERDIEAGARVMQARPGATLKNVMSPRNYIRVMNLANWFQRQRVTDSVWNKFNMQTMLDSVRPIFAYAILDAISAPDTVRFSELLAQEAVDEELNRTACPLLTSEDFFASLNGYSVAEERLLLDLKVDQLEERRTLFEQDDKGQLGFRLFDIAFDSFYRSDLVRYFCEEPSTIAHDRLLDNPPLSYDMTEIEALKLRMSEHNRLLQDLIAWRIAQLAACNDGSSYFVAVEAEIFLAAAYVPEQSEIGQIVGAKEGKCVDIGNKCIKTWTYHLPTISGSMRSTMSVTVMFWTLAISLTLALQ